MSVSVAAAGGAFTLEVRNDGAQSAPRGPGAGMGLKLAALDALQRGGVVEFGPGQAGEWRVRLVVPRAVSDRGRLRVLVVDDHDVVHWGFRLLLTEQPWVERCLTARDPEEARALARRYEPHVALVDLFLGDRSGAELCESLRRESPSTRVLLISGAGWISPQAARAAGARGSSPRTRAPTPWRPRCGRWAAGARSSLPARRSPRRRSPRASARCCACWHPGPPTRRSRSACTSRRTRSRSTRAPSIASSSVRNRAEAVQRAERLGLSG